MTDPANEPTVAFPGSGASTPPPIPADVPADVSAAIARPEARVGRYVLVSELGRGGMGVVHRAWDGTLRRYVALKMVLDPAFAEAEQLRRFQREASAAARLSHPSIVQVHDMGEHLGKPWFVMELVAGQSLAAMMKKGSIPRTRALEIARDVARALDHAHRHGVLHRDVKPDNIVIDDDGRARLMDFGLARDANDERLTATGQVLGTPSYMSPEQAGGEVKEQGPHSDVWSLGVVLYAMLAGAPPFRGESLRSVVKKILFDDVPPLVVPDLTPAIPALVQRCLDRDPKKRPTGADIARELDDLIGKTRNDAPPAPTRAPPPRSAPIAPIAVAVVAALGLGGVALVGFSGSKKEGAPVVAPPDPPPPPEPVEAPLPPPIEVAATKDLDGEQLAAAFERTTPPAWEDFYTKEPRVAVSGHVHARRPCVWLGERGKPLSAVKVDANGDFEASVEVAARPKATIVIQAARDAPGVLRIPVIVDVEPPRAVLDPPPRVSDGKVIVNLSVDDDQAPKEATITLCVGFDEVASETRPAYKGVPIEVSLAIPEAGDGPLAVKVVATDKAGNEFTVHYPVKR